METNQIQGCCGILILSDLSKNSKSNIETLYSCFGHDYGICVFTETTRNTNRATPLVRYITKNKLGKVHRGEARSNPNSNYKVRLYTWYIDKMALKSWADKHDIGKYEEDEEDYLWG